MPRNSQGGYSLPAGTFVNSGDTVLVSQHNPAFADVAQALTNSLDRNGSGGMLADLNMNGFRGRNLAPGVEDTDAATVGQLSNSNIPVGAIVDFAGTVAPTGWLLCGGQSVSRTTYSALFASIGTTYGSADGSSFNLPDLRGRVAAGADFAVAGTSNRLSGIGSNPGQAGGSQTHTLTSDQMPSHTHTGSTSAVGDHTHSGGTYGGGSAAYGNEVFVLSYNADTGPAGGHSHTMNLNNTGGGLAHPIVQPTIILNKIINAGIN